MSAAHQSALLAATTKAPPVNIPISKIASVGFPLHQYKDVEKVQRMQKSIRRGEKIKPVRVTKLTPENRDKYGVTDESKEYFLNNGHHRLAAVKLEGGKTVRAVPYQDGRI